MLLVGQDGPRAGSQVSGRPDDSALALGDYPSGPAPARGYLAGNEFRAGSDRTRFAVPPTSVTEFAGVTGGYLLGTRDDLGDGQVAFVGDDGTTRGSWRVVPGNFLPTFVIAPDHALVGVVQARGTSVVIEDAGRTVTRLPAPAPGGGFEPIAVTGHTCTGPDADCALLVHGPAPVNADGTVRRTWIVRPGRSAQVVDGGIGEVRAVAANGFTAGTTRVIDDGDGACAGVADRDGSVLWTTCKDRLIAFSPDAGLVLASTSALFGSGDHELTVLDASSGDQRLRLRTAKNVGIHEMDWEDDEHVLAVVSDWKTDRATESHTDVRWAVLRLGLDGSREYAVAPVAGEPEDYDGPIDLPAAEGRVASQSRRVPVLSTR